MKLEDGINLHRTLYCITDIDVILDFFNSQEEVVYKAVFQYLKNETNILVPLSVEEDGTTVFVIFQQTSKDYYLYYFTDLQDMTEHISNLKLDGEIKDTIYKILRLFEET